jgi:hypothetical protein
LLQQQTLTYILAQLSECSNHDYMSISCNEVSHSLKEIHDLSGSEYWSQSSTMPDTVDIP